MKENSIKLLSKKNLSEILKLTQHLNPNIPVSDLENRQIRMFEFENYHCFGFFKEDKLIGVSSGWITVRLYSDKQLEVDNVIIDPSIQSKGYGKTFLLKIEAWAKSNGCKTVELNTYLQSGRSHKFYFNLGYNILGFHFQKKLEG